MQRQPLQFANDLPARPRLAKVRLVTPTAPASAPRSSIKTASLRDLIDDWITECATRRKKRDTPTTSTNRQYFLDRFAKYICDGAAPICGIRQCQQFMAMIADKGCSPATERTWHAYLSAFFSWLVKKGLLDLSPMWSVECTDEKPKPRLPVDLDQIDMFIAAAAKSDNPERDVAIVRFLWDTGLRIGEACSIRMGDITFYRAQGGLRMKGIVCGKGRKWGEWFAESACTSDVRAYIRQRYRDGQGGYDEELIGPKDPLFLSGGAYKGQAITPNGIGQMLRRTEKRAREMTKGRYTAKICAHILRHTFTRDIFQNGATMPEAQAMLRHEDPRQTMHYAKVIGKNLEDAHRRVSPADNARERKR